MKLIVALTKEVTKMLEEVLTEKLPIRASYSLTKFLRKLQRETKDSEEVRMKLCLDYCKKDENGNPIQENGNFVFDEPVPQEFAKQMNELMMTEFDIEFKPLVISDFGENASIKGEYINAMINLGFIEDEDAVKEDEHKEEATDATAV
jgi:formiminotetrahydrofolate cyclodeaminase